MGLETIKNWFKGRWLALQRVVVVPTNANYNNSIAESRFLDDYALLNNTNAAILEGAYGSKALRDKGLGVSEEAIFTKDDKNVPKLDKDKLDQIELLSALMHEMAEEHLKACKSSFEQFQDVSEAAGACITRENLEKKAKKFGIQLPTSDQLRELKQSANENGCKTLREYALKGKELSVKDKLRILLLEMSDVSTLQEQYKKLKEYIEDNTLSTGNGKEGFSGLLDAVNDIMDPDYSKIKDTMNKFQKERVSGGGSASDTRKDSSKKFNGVLDVADYVKKMRSCYTNTNQLLKDVYYPAEKFQNGNLDQIDVNFRKMLNDALLFYDHPVDETRLQKVIGKLDEYEKAAKNYEALRRSPTFHALVDLYIQSALFENSHTYMNDGTQKPKNLDMAERYLTRFIKKVKVHYEDQPNEFGNCNVKAGHEYALWLDTRKCIGKLYASKIQDRINKNENNINTKLNYYKDKTPLLLGAKKEKLNVKKKESARIFNDKLESSYRGSLPSFMWDICRSSSLKTDQLAQLAKQQTDTRKEHEEQINPATQPYIHTLNTKTGKQELTSLKNKLLAGLYQPLKYTFGIPATLVSFAVDTVSKIIIDLPSMADFASQRIFDEKGHIHDYAYLPQTTNLTQKDVADQLYAAIKKDKGNEISVLFASFYCLRSYLNLKEKDWNTFTRDHLDEKGKVITETSSLRAFITCGYDILSIANQINKNAAAADSLIKRFAEGMAALMFNPTKEQYKKLEKEMLDLRLASVWGAAKEKGNHNTFTHKAALLSLLAPADPTSPSHFNQLLDQADLSEAQVEQIFKMVNKYLKFDEKEGKFHFTQNISGDSDLTPHDFVQSLVAKCVAKNIESTNNSALEQDVQLKAEWDRVAEMGGKLKPLQGSMGNGKIGKIEEELPQSISLLSRVSRSFGQRCVDDFTEYQNEQLAKYLKEILDKEKPNNALTEETIKEKPNNALTEETIKEKLNNYFTQCENYRNGIKDETLGKASAQKPILDKDLNPYLQEARKKLFSQPEFHKKRIFAQRQKIKHEMYTLLQKDSSDTAAIRRYETKIQSLHEQEKLLDSAMSMMPEKQKAHKGSKMSSKPTESMLKNNKKATEEANARDELEKMKQELLKQKRTINDLLEKTAKYENKPNNTIVSTNNNQNTTNLTHGLR